MTKKRINQLANFFYSSNDSNDVPLRITATTGQYSVFDFGSTELKELLWILEKSADLKRDLLAFREKYE